MRLHKLFTASAVVSGQAAIVVALATIPQNALALLIPTVSVGNVNNLNDVNDGDANTGGVQNFGSVNHAYRIATNEVTNAQYTEFLNRVAATDPFGLYNSTGMGLNPRGGITQSGVSGSFTYSVRADMGNKPVNFVSWYDAARFTNWLTNGQPLASEVPNSTEFGAYNLLGGTATPSNGLTVTRDVNAIYFLPEENEWYKAAYYNPAASSYFLNATGSNATPALASAIDTVGPTRGNVGNAGANVANYDLGADWNSQNGNVTSVGSATSTSPYGTLDQGGNVLEWNESLATVTARGIRGGSWSNPFLQLQSGGRSFGSPTTESNNLGFRVAFIPEPATLGIIAMAALATMPRRKR